MSSTSVNSNKSIMIELTSWEKVYALYNVMVETLARRALNDDEQALLDMLEALWEDRP